jgi:hypothetical protein
MPEIRGEPSARSVAIVLWRLSTRAATSRSAGPGDSAMSPSWPVRYPANGRNVLTGRCVHKGMRVSRAAVVASCVLAAGCGTVRLPAHAPGAASSVRTGRPATAAGNRAAAQAEAARLLSLARVPPGAVRVARPPRSLSGPALGTQGVASLVDRVVAWRVGLPVAAVRAWLSAHQPRGLPWEGSARSGSAGTGSAAVTGSSYRGPGNPAWQSADLEIGTAPAGPGVSMIRVDAVIVWLDPRPVPSGPGAHPVRVTVAGGCPPTDRGVTGVLNPGAGLTRRLLPPGPPTAGMRCRYDGLNGHPWQLVAADRLTARQARQAARWIAAMPLSHPDGEVVFCPFDDGSAEVLALAYAGRPDVDLWIRLNGCRGVSNGYIAAGRP